MTSLSSEPQHPIFSCVQTVVCKKIRDHNPGWSQLEKTREASSRHQLQHPSQVFLLIRTDRCLQPG